VERLAGALNPASLDGLLLVGDSNIRYITGFTGSESYAIISGNASGNARCFITDSRYTEQAEAECEGFEVIRWRSPAPGLTDTFQSICDRFGIRRLGFEKNKVTYEFFEKLSDNLRDIELVPTSGLVEAIRYVKDEAEAACIRKAARIADEAFSELLGFIRIGVTEKDIERELQYLIKKKGAEDIGFATIVASGKRSSLPHAIPSDKKIEKGDFITMDFGAMYMGYRSDMTRTVVVGAADPRQVEIYNIVRTAQEKAESAIRAGVSGKIPDDCARGHISAAGYGECFGHGLGHGVGLDIHEEPFMSSSCKRTLEEGCIVTVEPGIYIPDWGGVRIEDTVLVKPEGIEILTCSSKELLIIG